MDVLDHEGICNRHAMEHVGCGGQTDMLWAGLNLKTQIEHVRYVLVVSCYRRICIWHKTSWTQQHFWNICVSYVACPSWSIIFLSSSKCVDDVLNKRCERIKSSIFCTFRSSTSSARWYKYFSFYCDHSIESQIYSKFSTGTIFQFLSVRKSNWFL